MTVQQDVQSLAATVRRAFPPNVDRPWRSDKLDPALAALDALVARVAKLEVALREIAEMQDGDIDNDGMESDATVFGWADYFVEAHGIARSALADGKDAA